MKRIVAACLLSLPVAASGQLILTDRYIIVKHPSSPARQVVRQEGWCGATRYSVEFHAAQQDWRRRLARVRVGRRTMTAQVRTALARWVSEAEILQNAFFDQCSENNDGARLRLHLVARSADRRMRFLDIWLRRDGRIESIRYN